MFLSLSMPFSHHKLKHKFLFLWQIPSKWCDILTKNCMNFYRDRRFAGKVLKGTYNKYIFSESWGSKDNIIRILFWYPLALFYIFCVKEDLRSWFSRFLRFSWFSIILVFSAKNSFSCHNWSKYSNSMQY